MKTLAIGGTGFLGAHIVDSLLAAGHSVGVLSRSKARSAREVPESVDIIEGDLGLLDRPSLTEMMSGYDKLVYAAGVDERVRPDGDAREFYFRENVETCRNVLLAARDTEISHVVVLNSIFTCFNRLHPELKLTQHHPYIASRVAQSEMVIEVSRGHFVASVLEIPWVFGDTKGKPSQWSALVSYVRYTRRLVAPNGGAVAISAKNVGRATLGALSAPRVSARIPIGDCQLSWDDMLRQLAKLSGKNDVSVMRMPDSVFAGLMRMGSVTLRLIGEKSGLDFSRLGELLTREFDVDLAASQKLLDYGDPDIEPALAATVASVPDYRRAATWSRLAPFKFAAAA
ncbi:NAD-dependent epimerase/dehydratase family protein [Pseudohalioglobus sediminis]|uniref:NAD-dependent epimerase/dehydratase family protein n=1 Tax=Pseudohalioglobus sediminis TaxID=2606449 RepID=A0A5B0WQP2_9GAMM|nr:NAD-dependent epimerase/dehydratase family protein [Pseudohalioglobus sediminis]KAA1189434.1 NAD-dependent epimerase/dehydratase family protein [Pseudohalioglobus sediminis]